MKHFRLKKYEDYQELFSGRYSTFLECLEDAVRLGTDLSGIDLRYKNLSNGNLDSAQLAKADLTGANLTGANLSEACLYDSIFLNTSLYNTCFCYSDLRSCDFRSASFGGTDITGCDISFSTFSTLSCFDLDFWHAEKMEGCRYLGFNGKISSMAKRPMILKGLMNVPIIILDHEVHIGQGTFPKQNFPKLLELIEIEKTRFLQRQ